MNKNNELKFFFDEKRRQVPNYLARYETSERQKQLLTLLKDDFIFFPTFELYQDEKDGQIYTDFNFILKMKEEYKKSIHNKIKTKKDLENELKSNETRCKNFHLKYLEMRLKEGYLEKSLIHEIRKHYIDRKIFSQTEEIDEKLNKKLLKYLMPFIEETFERIGQCSRKKEIIQENVAFMNKKMNEKVSSEDLNMVNSDGSLKRDVAEIFTEVYFELQMKSGKEIAEMYNNEISRKYFHNLCLSSKIYDEELWEEHTNDGYGITIIYEVEKEDNFWENKTIINWHQIFKR